MAITSFVSKLSRDSLLFERLCVILALTAIYVFVLRHIYWFEFYPLNGVFQTFNPIDRIDHGQQIFVDTFPYLGASSSLLLYWLLKIAHIPIKLAYVTAANEFVHILLFIASGYLILRLVTKQRFLAFAAPVLLALVAIYIKQTNPYASIDKLPIHVIFEFIFPGNSNLGLRSFALSILAVLLAIATKSLLDSEKQKNLSVNCLVIRAKRNQKRAGERV